MSVDGKEKIVLGSGKLFVLEYDSATGIPEDTVVEAEINQVGLIQGGATLEYKPTFYTAKDD
ncbi:hypothetical protein FDB14_19195, partial [Clostridium botulinum]|nr:hypothetical protein [Clostridium botulinum]NFK66600.1 hypothetical protein [Clostridium botulinum]NFK70219.1 hypothetical protein [Clostridium botulinum]NFK98259.1 hypothetical protein [Clostridium botulinum]